MRDRFGLSAAPAITATGGVSPADRERVASMRAGMADASAVFKGASRHLMRLTGAVPASMAWSPPASELAVPAERDTARELALQQNVKLLTARAEVVALEVELDIARSRFLPRVELERTLSRTTHSGGQENFSRDTRDRVVLSPPLAGGGADLAQLLGSNRPLEVLDAFQRLHQSRLDLTRSQVTEAQSQLRVAHLKGSLTSVFSVAFSASP